MMKESGRGSTRTDKTADGGTARRIAGLCVRALLYEVATSPKPGLVDRANSGSHRDMDIFTFVDSAAALGPYFETFAAIGMEFLDAPAMLLPALRPAGKRAEECMLAATHGVNTHKGAIFSLGILCASIGMLLRRETPLTADLILNNCAAIARAAAGEFDKIDAARPSSGQRAYCDYGILGIRGEAAAGFPNVSKYGYPALCKAVAEGCSLNDAGVAALFHLMAHVDDTTIIARAGEAALRGVQRDAADFLAQAPSMSELLAKAREWDARFIAENISPGGSADLLALSFMLFFCLNESY